MDNGAEYPLRYWYVVEGKHNTSIDDLSEAALSIPAIDVVMDRKHEKAERHRAASAMVSQIRDKLTETQFRRLWMYYVGGMTVDEIGRIEGIRHQNICHLLRMPPRLTPFHTANANKKRPELLRLSDLLQVHYPSFSGLCIYKDSDCEVRLN